MNIIKSTYNNILDILLILPGIIVLSIIEHRLIPMIVRRLVLK